LAPTTGQAHVEVDPVRRGGLADRRGGHEHGYERLPLPRQILEAGGLESRLVELPTLKVAQL